MALLAIAIVHLESTILQPSQQTIAARQFAGQFRAYSLAAMYFAEANHGYSGQISDAQLAPYLTPWTPFLSQHAAGIQGGVLDVWAMPPGIAVTQNAWVVQEVKLTDGDVAYAINNGGTLISPVGGNLGPAPAGIPNNAAVYQIQAPN
ncbi:MAG: type IV pilus biogenesis protein PilM [Acidiferrobacterales bacterium]